MNCAESLGMNKIPPCNARDIIYGAALFIPGKASDMGYHAIIDTKYALWGTCIPNQGQILYPTSRGRSQGMSCCHVNM